MKFKLAYTFPAAVILFSSLNLNAQENAQYNSSYINSYYNHRLGYFEAMPNNKNEIVFLGNSITEGGEWQELLPKLKHVINRGIGGDNSFGVLARLDEVISSKPKKIFLMIGINDLTRKIPIEVIAGNIQKIIDRTKAESPKTKLYLQSVLPVNTKKAAATATYKNNNPSVLLLNEQIKALASKNNLIYINLHPLFADPNGELKEDFTRDGIHINGACYIDWVNHLRKQKLL